MVKETSAKQTGIALGLYIPASIYKKMYQQNSECERKREIG
jgi:hypothetical protein